MTTRKQATPHHTPELPAGDEAASYVVRFIPPLLVEAMWHYALPYLKRALDHASGEISHEDLHDYCAGGQMQLWLVVAGARVVGAITTKLVQYPKAKHCTIVTLAGTNFPDWMPLADATLLDFARRESCTQLVAYVRRGFVPKLASIGYKHGYSVVIKDTTL